MCVGVCGGVSVAKFQIWGVKSKAFGSKPKDEFHTKGRKKARKKARKKKEERRKKRKETGGLTRGCKVDLIAGCHGLDPDDTEVQP